MTDGVRNLDYFIESELEFLLGLVLTHIPLVMEGKKQLRALLI
jgi:hypothetical protein